MIKTVIRHLVVNKFRVSVYIGRKVIQEEIEINKEGDFQKWISELELSSISFPE